MEKKKRVLILSTTFVCFFFILTRIQRYNIKYVRTSVYKIPVILARFWPNVKLSTEFRKIFKYQISWKVFFAILRKRL